MIDDRSASVIIDNFNRQVNVLPYQTIIDLNKVESFKIINSQVMNNVDTSSYDVEQVITVNEVESLNNFLNNKFLDVLGTTRTFSYNEPNATLKNDFIVVELFGSYENIINDVLFMLYYNSDFLIEYSDNLKCAKKLLNNFRFMDEYKYNLITKSDFYNDFNEILYVDNNIILNYSLGDFITKYLHKHAINKIFFEVNDLDIILESIDEVYPNFYLFKIRFNFIYNNEELPLNLGNNINENKNLKRKYDINIYIRTRTNFIELVKNNEIKSIIIIFG